MCYISVIFQNCTLLFLGVLNVPLATCPQNVLELLHFVDNITPLNYELKLQTLQCTCSYGKN